MVLRLLPPVWVWEDDLVDGPDSGGQYDDGVESLVNADATGEDWRVSKSDPHAVTIKALVE